MVHTRQVRPRQDNSRACLQLVDNLCLSDRALLGRQAMCGRRGRGIDMKSCSLRCGSLRAH